MINLDTARLPSFNDLSTAHWSADQQIQLSKAVDGILSAPWFQVIAEAADSDERHRVATAFAFAAFSHLRNRMRLAPDEELMLDNKGRAAPAGSTDNKADGSAVSVPRVPGTAWSGLLEQLG
jgi:hypothetical protein